MNKAISIRDYSLTGVDASKALEEGLADAQWYQSPVPKEQMKQLLERKDGPAIRDTLLWFGLILGSGALVYVWWGSWPAVLPYIVYSVLYASSSDSRWHESSHGTAFKTDWMNNALYEAASFMVFRQSTVWRWSHARHHSDTIIRGRDPEIAVKRPPKTLELIKTFLGLGGAIPEIRRLLLHAAGKIDPEVATYLPESEYGKVILKARIYLSIYIFVIVLSVAIQSILPLMYIGLPTILGTWLMPVYGLTQHAGLQENVLDHRMNCRTVYMNRVHRFLYWNMNYHVEHHMFPLVPYHALPKLHELIKDDCPPAYQSIWDAYREIVPALRRQMKDTSYYVERKLPEGAGTLEQQVKERAHKQEAKINNGKIEVCPAVELGKGEVLRFDFEQHTFAVYRTRFDNYYATEGNCSHGNAHLADGVLIDEMIECGKHNGRFNLSDGSPARVPVCEGIQAFKVEQVNGILTLDLNEVCAKIGLPQGKKFRVKQNRNLSAFMKELELEPMEASFSFRPGQYIHLHIPPHRTSFPDFQLEESFCEVWEREGLFKNFAESEVFSTRNYSLASNPEADSTLKFNIRIALSPQPGEVPAGAGSSYVFGLKPDDEVQLSGPFGDFLLKDTGREMIYLGGGAGMAPIRSHISYLFETLKTRRKVSLWYGARTQNELFYIDYFEKLQQNNPNFRFVIALSEQEPGAGWEGNRGFIHEVLYDKELKKRSDLSEVEFYLCGPPPMIAAATKMLEQMGVSQDRIAFDAF